jgi:hypothetical protein
MTLHLTAHEAQRIMHQVDQQMVDVRTLASKILDTTEAMCGSSWQGNRAQTFRAIMQQHTDDFNTVINAMQLQVVDKGKDDIHALVNADSQ